MDVKSAGTANRCPKSQTSPSMSPNDRYPATHATGSTNHPRATGRAESRSPADRPSAASATSAMAIAQVSLLWSRKTSSDQRSKKPGANGFFCPRHVDRPGARLRADDPPRGQHERRA